MFYDIIKKGGKMKKFFLGMTAIACVYSAIVVIQSLLSGTWKKEIVSSGLIVPAGVAIAIFLLVAAVASIKVAVE